MSCTDQVVCSLEELTRAVSNPGFDLNSFLATIAATLVGAGISFVAAWSVFKRENDERYKTRVDDGLTLVIQRITEHAKVMQAREAEEVARRPTPAVPLDFDLSAALTIAEIKANKPGDRAVISALQDAVFGFRDLSANEQKIGLGALMDIIRRWRGGQLSGKDAIAETRDPQITESQQ